MRSVQTSPKVWRMILVQFVVPYRMVKVLGQCDLSFRSSDHKLSGVDSQTWILMRSIRSSPMSLCINLVQFVVLYRMVEVLCQCDLPFQSNESRLLWDGSLFGIFWKFLKKFISWSRVSSSQFGDLTYDYGTVCCALSNGWGLMSVRFTVPE